MDYIQFLLPAAPLAFCAAIVIYAGLYMLFKNKRGKLGKLKMLAELALTGWICMYVYVTQIMAFGNDMGGGINLAPFGDFLVAFRYGSNNARLVWQSLLNVIMVMPLGFLLPVVFPKKTRRFINVLLFSFGAAFLTETVQFFVGRGSDIDDVIANTLGGVCGFAVWSVIDAAVTAIGKKSPPRPARRTIASILILCFTAAPFIAVSFSDGGSEFGNFYYGHNIPSAVNIPDSISREEGTGRVYKAVTRNSLRDVENMLKAAVGINGNFEYEQGVLSLSEGARRIIIDDKNYNTWSVAFHYSETAETDIALLPNETEDLKIAWERLGDYGITSGDVRYAGLLSGYGDKRFHLSFESSESAESQMVYGNVYATVGENGELYSIGDKRVWCVFEKEIPCISPYEAIQTARKVGVGDWAGTADVSAVKRGYTLIKETGYIIPAWNIAARFTANSGGIYEWNPVIDAVK